jgi:hypothetical protein
VSRPTLPRRAILFRLAALLAVGWSAACASIGTGPGDPPLAQRERPGSSAGDHHWRGLATHFTSGVQTLDDRNDDEERSRNFKLPCAPITGRISLEWGCSSSNVLRIGFLIPPRGSISPRLRC